MEAAIHIVSSITGLITLIIALKSSDFSISKKSRIEVAKQLKKAIKNNDQVTTQEAFCFLFGSKSRLSFEDIKSFCSRNDFNDLAFCLKKLPGLCRYSNGKLSYRGLSTIPGAMKIIQVYAVFSALSMSGFIVYLIVNSFGSGIEKTLASLVVGVFPAALLYISINIYDQISRLKKVVRSEEKNVNS